MNFSQLLAFTGYIKNDIALRMDQNRSGMSTPTSMCEQCNKMNNGQDKFDWPGFCIHFFFGALVGVVVGFRCWTRSDWALSTSATPGVLIVSGGALLVGLLAGLAKDDFWSEAGETSAEWPWAMLKILCYAAGFIGLVWFAISLFR